MGNEEISSNYPMVQSIVHSVISIQLNKSEFFQDDYIRGKIILHPMQPILLHDISIKLLASESWIYTITESNVNTQINNSTVVETTVGVGKKLNITTHLINLQPATFEFPFSIKIPPTALPVFEFPLPNRRGFIRYNLVAEIVSNYASGKAEVPVVVLSRPKELSNPIRYDSIADVRMYGMFSKGHCQIFVQYPSNNWKVGTEVPIAVEVNNKECKLTVNCLRIVLTRKVDFYDKTGACKFTNQKKLFQSDFPINVTSGQVGNYNYSIPLTDNQINEYNYYEVFNPYKNVNLNIMMPSVNGTLIKCDYFIKVTAYFSSMVSYSYRPRVILPLSITHQVQSEYIAEAEMRRQLEESVMQENNQILNISHSQFQAQEVQSYQMGQQSQLGNQGLMRANTYNTNVVPPIQNNYNNNVSNDFPDFNSVNNNSNPPVPQPVQNQYPDVNMISQQPQQQAHPNTIYATFNNTNNNNYLQKSRTMNQYPSYYNQPNSNVYNNNQNYNNNPNMNYNQNNNNIPRYPPAEDNDAPQTAWNA